MAWIDIVILAIVVLFGVIGVLRGVKKSALSLGAFAVAFILAFFLANVIAEAFVGISGIQSFVLGNGKFGEEGGFSLANMIYMGLGENNGGVSLDSYLGSHFFAPIIEIVGKSNVLEPRAGTAVYMAFLMFSALIGVAIFIVVRFLLMIVTAIIKSYIDKKKSVGSRLGGFFVAALNGGIVAFVLCIIFSCFGGLTFIPAFASVESEFEHKNAIVCTHIYSGAFFIRNNVFMPGEGMYGRIASLVADAEYVPPEDNTEKLTGDQLEMFINVSNLNYDGTPWSINADTRRREFDAENATPYVASEFDKVGFANVVQAILDYNTRAAASIDDPAKAGEYNWATLNGFVAANTPNINQTFTSFIGELRAYINDYNHGLTLDEKTEIDAWNLELRNSYLAVVDKYNALKDRYSHVEQIFGTFPESALPDCVTAGRVDEPENPDNPDVPEVPENPDNPDVPEVPENPDNPDVPEVPENPDNPDVPEVPENPDNPDVPEVPENPDNPDVPEVPENPDNPDVPEVPENPDNPDVTEDNNEN